MSKYITVLVLSLMLSGCASYPIAKDLRDRAQPLTWTQVTANPEYTRDAIVIWGGRVVDAVNDTNGGEIYVRQMRLNRKGKPASDDTVSGGHFIVVSREPLDSNEYPAGRLITVAGRLEGVRNERVQNIFYRYPVLEIAQIHLWAGQQKDYYYYDYGAYPEWYWGFYSPLWWDGGVGWYNPGGDGVSHGPNQGEDFRSGGEHR
jgi:outer membrane lipoprotein